MRFSCCYFLAMLAVASPAPCEEPVRLTVAPMAMPTPALTYRLLPELRELNPGNPAQWYIRSFQEQRNFFFGKSSVVEREQYRSMPLAELPAEMLRHYGGSALRQADWGARLDTLDWQAIPRVQAEGLSARFPELETLRLLGPALQVRFRGQIAGQHFDEAVAGAKTMFAFARHLGEHPTVEACMAGMAAANLTLDTIEEMIQQPKCPNLYWALSELPSRPVGIRMGLQGQQTAVDCELKSLRTDRAMTNEELEAFISKIFGAIGLAREQAGRSPKNLRSELAALVQDRERLRAARARLLQSGGPGDYRRGIAALQVAVFSEEQAILLDEKQRFETQRDDLVKSAVAPAWQAADMSKTAESSQLFSDLLPPVESLRATQRRLEQRIAVLRIVEALRAYAAEHAGHLPNSLAKISWPLPSDPLTGKPFDYAVNHGCALIRSGQCRYSVTIHP